MPNQFDNSTETVPKQYSNTTTALVKKSSNPEILTGFCSGIGIPGLIANPQNRSAVPAGLKGLLLSLLMVPVLWGCTDAGMTGDYEDYLTRLARVLEQDVTDWQAQIPKRLPQRYPETKQRTLNFEDTRLGVFDFLSLGDCELQHLVSERNSSLGKVMSVTARYQYEWMLLNGLEVCLNQLRELPDDEDDLMVKLDHIRQVKSRELDRHYWNATWGSSDFETFFSMAHPVLQDQEVSGIQPEVTQSLFDYFQALPQPDKAGTVKDQKDSSFFAESQRYESHLQPLQYHYGGRLIRSLVTATAAVNEGTRLLEAAMKERPICYNETPSRKAEILQNVFTHHYVMRLQPYLSRLDKEAALLFTATHRHSPAGFSVQTAEVLSFYDTYLNVDKTNALATMRRAVKQHALVWNRLLRGCGMKVGGNR